MRRRRLIPVGLAALLAVAYLGFVDSGNPVTAAPTTPLVWSQETTTPESGEIFVAQADGASERRLTNDAQDDKWPKFSFDGTFVAHVGTESPNEARAVIIRRTDGTGATIAVPINGNANSLEWAPSDYRLAFNDTAGDGTVSPAPIRDRSDVYVFNVTTSTLIEITDEDEDNTTATPSVLDDPYDDVFPRWSPDGTRLAWFAEPDQNDTADPNRGQSEIMVANADNSGTTLRLTDNDYDDNWPWWSPDGTQLVWAGEIIDADDACGGPCPTNASDEDPDLFVGSSTGPVNSGTRITSDANVPNPAAACPPPRQCGPSHPEWSPDGSRIAFAVGVENGDGDGPSEAWVINPNGTGAQQLTTDGSRHYMWDPSGSPRLAVYHVDSGNDNGAPLGVFDASAPATPEVVLTTRGTRWFDWSADGQQIAYQAIPEADPTPIEADFEIFTESPNGTGEVRLTTNTVVDAQPDFAAAQAVVPPPPPPPAGGGGGAAPVNRPPVAQNLAVNTPTAQALTINLQASDPDNDPLTFSIVGQPANGTLSTVNGNQVIYTPRAGFSGTDSFTYRARDREADSNTATVTITVQAPPPPPPDPIDYRMAGGDGGVFAFGNAEFLGTAGVDERDAQAAQVQAPSRRIIPQPVAGIDHIPGDAGYWLVTGDGRIFAFGVGSLGSLEGRRLNAPITGIAAMPRGRGYLLAGEDGGVFAFGNARYRGGLGALRLAGRIVGIETTPTGDGYYLLGEDGGVFAFGDARFHGAARGRSSPAVGMAVAPDGSGYWIAFADGAVVPVGAVRSLGSMEGRRLNRPVVGITAHENGRGYWLASSDGGIFAFGAAPYRGSLANGRTNTPGPGCCIRLNRPIVDIAS